MAGSAVIGVVRAMDEAGVAGGTFSIIAPRCTDSNRYFGTSIADVSALIVSMVRDKLNNQLPPQRLKLVGVEDPAVQRFELCPSVKTPELQKLVDDVTKGINDGSIKLPAGV